MTPNDTENAARAHEPEAAEGAPASAPEAAPKGDAAGGQADCGMMLIIASSLGSLAGLSLSA